MYGCALNHSFFLFFWKKKEIAQLIFFSSLLYEFQIFFGVDYVGWLKSRAVLKWPNCIVNTFKKMVSFDNGFFSFSWHTVCRSEKKFTTQAISQNWNRMMGPPERRHVSQQCIINRTPECILYYFMSIKWKEAKKNSEVKKIHILDWLYKSYECNSRIPNKN